MFSLVQGIVFGCLLWASKQDLETHRVSDLVWMVAAGASMLVASLNPGVYSVFGMVVQAGVLIVLGFVLDYFSSFGAADIIALGFIGLAVPGPRPLFLAGIVLGVAIIYQKFFYRLTGEKAVPLIPGLLLGYTLFLLVF